MAGAPNDLAVNYKYDPQKAKQLLAEAGYPNGLKKKLFPASAQHLQNTEALQASARLAGVELELVPGEHTSTSAPAISRSTWAIQAPACPIRSRQRCTTRIILTIVTKRNSVATTCGASHRIRLSSWFVDKSKTEPDPEKRADLFRQMDEIYRKMDPGLIVFFQRTDPYVVRKNVKGYLGHPACSTRWSTVTKG